MKFTTQEEYGLRCLVRLGYSYTKGIGLTIPDISNSEGISEDNIATVSYTHLTLPTSDLV